MYRPSLPDPPLTRTRLKERWVRIPIRKALLPLHSNKQRNNAQKTRPFAVPFDQTVPEKGVGAENAVEDGGRVREGSEGVGEADELGYEEVILLQTFVYNVGVDLLEMGLGFAGFEQRCD
ncbi:hypothetical protein FF1_027971 [Malus domestica]